MNKTLYAAKVVRSQFGALHPDESKTVYLWKFGKYSERSLRGAEKVDTTVDEGRAMMRSSRTSIEQNIVRAQATRPDLTFEVVEFEVVAEYSAYQYGIQGTAAEHAAQVEGAHHRNYGDFVYVVRPKAEVAEFEGDIVVHADDWALIESVLSAGIANGIYDKPTAERLASMKVVRAKAGA